MFRLAVRDSLRRSLLALNKNSLFPRSTTSIARATGAQNDRIVNKQHRRFYRLPLVRFQEDELKLEQIERRDNTLVITWNDGGEHEYHLCWLRDNCPCCLTSSGQKKHRVINPDSESLDIVSVEIDKSGESIEVLWKDHDKSSNYDAIWLRKFGYSTLESEFEYNSAKPNSKTIVDLPTIQYKHVIENGDSGLFEWMSLMNDSGFCVIRNAPTKLSTVKDFANLVGPVSHTIYGETFEVKATPKPINIAYSDSALEAHMDLAYFESPPGVQMLHCIEFDDAILGGDSTLIDAHAVAEELQDRDPEVFDILSRVPATFQKDHSERSHPVKMFYQRPHISVNYLNQVTAVFWSPPFEGPLRVQSEFVEPYYKAYNVFRNLLNSQEMWEKYGVCFRLKPGELVTFNNRRMLHGRNAFTSENGNRHLQGCYLDVDTYLNKFRILSEEYDPMSNLATLGAVNEGRFGTTNHR